MDDGNRQKILIKNEKLINMVIERAKRDFPEDIAIIGLTGSFSTGDFHEKSDLDLIIINNTDRGWGISTCFILEDIGYDIYCTPWETRIEDEANLESPMISHLVDLQILYCAKPEYMDKFNLYKQRALDALAKPIGRECIRRAKKYLDVAKQEYTNTLLSEDLGAIRYASCGVLFNLVNALTNLNNTYFKRGLKRYLEEIGTYRYIPGDFEMIYMAVIDAKTPREIRSASYNILKSMNDLYHKMDKDFVVQPVPGYDNLAGTYEELWCNLRNKILVSVELGDKSYAYLTAMSTQNFLDEMTETRGTKKFELMQYFDSDHLNLFKDQFLQAMDEYLEEYSRVGRKVERYDTFEQLYNQYMKLEDNEIVELIQETAKQFISSTATVLEMESTPLNMGYQAVNLSRHKVLIEDQGTKEYISLITKMANKAERRILHRLLLQSANVPYSRTHDLDSDDRALLCIQDVDYKTNYQNLNVEMLQKKEMHALAYIHKMNHGLKEELSWLPLANHDHIEQMIYGRWKPVWEEAKQSEQFMETFGQYIPEVEAISGSIVNDIEVVLNDERSHTLIHNDLNPGNVLVHNNDDVFFIDWEEARYGSFFLDIPLRFELKQAVAYHDMLASLGLEIPVDRFEPLYAIASRYLGLRFMTWNLGAWTSNPSAKEGLQKYLNMATS